MNITDETTAKQGEDIAVFVHSVVEDFKQNKHSHYGTISGARFRIATIIEGFERVSKSTDKLSMGRGGSHLWVACNEERILILKED